MVADPALPRQDAVQFLCGDARTVLAGLPDQSVHACVTSPPYFGLRKYSDSSQEIGTEQTPQEYVAALVEVFQGVWRVLRDDGLLFIVLGDTFGAGKQLLGIPWRVAFALQDTGWILRSDIIFSKPNPMPESVRDRVTRAHETVFMFAKQPQYYYDQLAIAEPCTTVNDARNRPDYVPMRQRNVGGRSDGFTRSQGAMTWPDVGRNKRSVWTVATAPFSSKKYGCDVDHFAAYPPELIRPMVRAATSEKGVCPACGAPWQRQVERQGMVIARSDRREKMGEQGRTQSSGTMLSPATSTTIGWEPGCSCNAGEPVPATILDPCAGACTSALVARQEGRNAIMVDIRQDYLDLGRARLRHELGLFSGVEAE